MSNRSKRIQGTSLRATHVASALFAGLLALSATFVVPVVAPTNHGGSVHAKNAATPDWIVKRQTQNAHQMPVVIGTDEPSFWI
ncbi:MAG TPA: hypothetical protein VMO81_11180 [Aestuariivirgaceae bacterium]|nr:hypothetical protein [Aestuariivirgaceae bacterium]